MATTETLEIKNYRTTIFLHNATKYCRNGKQAAKLISKKR